MRKNKLILTGICICLILAAGMTMNMEVSIRQGINGRIREIKMPLYIKAMEFLTRHYEYQRIAKEITKGCNTEEEKVLAILKWTHENIKPLPLGMPMVDDHILNIIIRGYGAADQSEDVFANLCSYAGIPSFYMLIRANDRKIRYPLSFVKIDGKWQVFDSYYNIYFRTKTGEIASVDDIIADKSIVRDADIAGIVIGEVPYKEFYYSLKPIGSVGTLRPDKQMPLKRIVFEIKKALGMEKEIADADGP